MSPRVQRTNEYDRFDYRPIILNFSEYYREKNDIQSERLRPAHKIRVVIPQNKNNSLSPTTYEVSDTHTLKNNIKSNAGFIITALTSAALAIGAVTTNVLDRFGESTKKILKLGLSIGAIGLVTITANGLSNNLSGKSNVNIKNNLRTS